MRDKNTIIQQKKTINAGGRLIDFSSPKVMGILNITPDSFYPGSRLNTVDAALKRASEMLEQGADIIDVGAYSSRPGAADIPISEEKERLLPIVKALVREFPKAVLSVDTFRCEVAKAAVLEGAHIVNDISGGELDAEMFNVIAELKVPYIIMHMRGTPQNMKQLTEYDNMFNEILKYFARKMHELRQHGVNDIILDPGFGFAKTIKQNFELLNDFHRFTLLGVPVLAGISRKSMIWKTLGIKSEDALNGTTVLNTIALTKGANLLRVHDVQQAREAIELVSQFNN